LRLSSPPEDGKKFIWKWMILLIILTFLHPSIFVSTVVGKITPLSKLHIINASVVRAIANFGSSFLPHRRFQLGHASPAPHQLFWASLALLPHENVTILLGVINDFPSIQLVFLLQPSNDLLVDGFSSLCEQRWITWPRWVGPRMMTVRAS
jgi:hypothetical protein